jgi:hypothetical protein
VEIDTTRRGHRVRIDLEAVTTEFAALKSIRPKDLNVLGRALCSTPRAVSDNMME